MLIGQMPTRDRTGQNRRGNLETVALLVSEECPEVWTLAE
jgi:hypothetical protein